jgi:hypothetical protein
MAAYGAPRVQPASPCGRSLHNAPIFSHGAQGRQLLVAVPPRHIRRRGLQPASGDYTSAEVWELPYRARRQGLSLRDPAQPEGPGARAHQGSGPGAARPILAGQRRHAVPQGMRRRQRAVLPAGLYRTPSERKEI